MTIQPFHHDVAEIFSAAVSQNSLTVSMFTGQLLDRGRHLGLFWTSVWFIADSFSMENVEEKSSAKRLSQVSQILKSKVERAKELTSLAEKKRRSGNTLASNELDEMVAICSDLEPYLKSLVTEERILNFLRRQTGDSAWADGISQAFIDLFYFHSQWSEIERKLNVCLAIPSGSKQVELSLRKIFENIDLTPLNTAELESLAQLWVSFGPKFLLFQGMKKSTAAWNCKALGYLSIWGLREIYSHFKNAHEQEISSLKEGRKVYFSGKEYTVGDFEESEWQSHQELPLVEDNTLALLVYREPHKLWEDYVQSADVLYGYMDEHLSASYLLIKKNRPLLSLEDAVYWTNTLVAMKFSYITPEGGIPKKADFCIDAGGKLHLTRILVPAAYDLDILQETTFNLADCDFEKYKTLYSKSMLHEHPLIAYRLVFFGDSFVLQPHNAFGQTELYSHRERVAFHDHYFLFIKITFDAIQERFNEEGIRIPYDIHGKFIEAFLKSTRGIISDKNLHEKIFAALMPKGSDE